jgi:hypothetical protein
VPKQWDQSLPWITQPESWKFIPLAGYLFRDGFCRKALGFIDLVYLGAQFCQGRQLWGLESRRVAMLGRACGLNQRHSPPEAWLPPILQHPHFPRWVIWSGTTYDHFNVPP